MLTSSNEGKCERMRKTSIRENSTLTSKTTENMEGTTNPAMRESAIFRVRNAWFRQGSHRYRD